MSSPQVPPVLRAQYSSHGASSGQGFGSAQDAAEGVSSGGFGARFSGWARKLGVERVLEVLGGARSRVARINPYRTIKSIEEATRRGRRELKAALDFRAFSRPRGTQETLSRLRGNCSSFPIVYALVYASVFLYYLLVTPMLLVAVGITTMSWTYAFLIRDGSTPISVGGMVLQRRDKIVILSIISAIAVLFSGLISTIFWVMTFGSCFNGTHAVMRERTSEPEDDPFDDGADEALVGDPVELEDKI